jgi:pSer/pThr/pTyr-binding forkhead associated (FHA) protein
MKFCRNCGTGLGQTTPGSPAMAAAPMMPSQQAGVLNTLPQTPSVLPSAGRPMPVAAAVPAPVPVAPPRAQNATIACPRCGTQTPLGFAYCQQCGLHMQPIAPTDPGAVVPAAAPRAPSAVQPVSPLAAAIDAHGATIASPDARGSIPGIGPRPSAANVARGPAWGTAVLVNRDGSDGQRFQLTAEDTVIGRAGSDIAFDDDRFLAHQHARLSRAADGSVTITPIDTLNGVFRKTDGSVELGDGTTILVGREVLRFEKLGADERTVHPLVRHGVALFGSPPREPWGRLFQLIPSGGYRDVRHLVGDEVVLGREEGDIVFRDDAFMSRRHAAITWDGKAAKLTDLGSSNGTFVRVTSSTPLKHGDHVRMGDQLLRIER